MLHVKLIIVTYERQENKIIIIHIKLISRLVSFLFKLECVTNSFTICLYNLFKLHQSNITYNICKKIKIQCCKHTVSKQMKKVVSKELQKHILSAVS